jgi:hypothetical protein
MILHFVRHRFYILVGIESHLILSYIDGLFYCFVLVAVSFDRYVAIEYPLKYKQKMTKRTIFILIGGIWLISFLLSYGPVLLGVYNRSRTGVTASDPTECGMRPNLIYSIISSSTSFYIPLIMILFLYGRIFITARKHSHELQKLEDIIKRLHRDEKFVLESVKWKKNIKAIRTLGSFIPMHTSHSTMFVRSGIVVGVFIACWLPFFVMYLLLAYCNYSCVNGNVERYITWIGRRISTRVSNQQARASHVMFRLCKFVL